MSFLILLKRFKRENVFSKENYFSFIYFKAFNVLIYNCLL